MGRKMQRFLLSAGLVLYLFDLGSDIYVAVRHWKNGETWWFWLTAVFIIVPSVIVNFAAIFKFVNSWSCITAIVQLSIVARYIEALEDPDSQISNLNNSYRRTRWLAILRYLETITESAPQWCLQVYIMLRQWSFPLYTVVSSVFSMLSLVWSITLLQKETRKEKSKKFTLTDALQFATWQMCTLISRLSAIVIFAYVFPRYSIIIFLAVHWLILVVTIFLMEIRNGGSLGKSLLLSFLAGGSHLVHSAENDLPTKRPNMTFGYLVHILMSLVMIWSCMIRAVDRLDVPHMNVLMLIGTVLVQLALLFSMLFYVTYHHASSKTNANANLVLVNVVRTSE